MSAPQITVLITTYNYGQFIQEAIDSVLAQDFPSDKVDILVVDDGSTDDTSERVKKYGSRIEYLYKPNGGQASALNVGIANARGEIIALLDADDIFLPGKLARVAEAFEQDPALGMVYHRLWEWHTQTDERREWTHFYAVSGDIQKVPDQFLLYITQPTSCISFRRSSLNRLLPIPESIHMLADCYLVALIPFLSPILAIPEFLGIYRIHGTNCYYADERQMPAEAMKNRLQTWQIVIDAMHKWLTDNGYNEKQPPVRAFLDRWSLYQESQRFILNPPGRLQFFRYLQACKSYYRPHMNWRFRTVSNVNAFGSLLVGYGHFYLLDQWRVRGTNFFWRLFKPLAPRRADEQASSPKV
jgi:glycosyltransferase involved in cell wall biosynthesis